MDLHTVIHAECDAAAKSAARRWPSQTYADFYQEGWLQCLEAVSKLSPDKAPGPYFGAILRRAIPRYGLRSASALRLPRNNEYKHTIAKVAPVGHYDPDDPFSGVDPSDCTGDMASKTACETALRIVEDVLDRPGFLPAARVLLDGEEIDEAAQAAGLTATEIRTMVACAQVQIVRDKRFAELAGDQLPPAVLDKIRYHAGATA